MPGSWGLKGRFYEEAKAHYHLEGEELERRLTEIHISDECELQLAMLRIDVKYGHLKEFEFRMKEIELTILDDIDAEIQRTEVQYEFGVLNKNEYEKKIATLRNEPWVAVIKSSLDASEGKHGFAFELDWNVYWIEVLRSEGYVGHNEEEIIEKWFSEISREAASEVI